MAATAIPTTRYVSISSPSSSSSSCPRCSLSSLDFSSNCRRIGCRSRPPLLLRFRAAAAASSSESNPAAPVEVIGIGSRKDALIDFCLSNPIASSRLRFWTVHSRDCQKVQLLQRCQGTEIIIRDVKFPLSLLPCPAVILVNDLVNKLQECSHLFIVVEADSLLNEEMETLAEASDSLNNAVFLAMHTISILMSEVHLKILNTPDGQMKEVGSFEILHLLETYGEAKVGFGAGYNLKSAIMHAAFHCPSLCSELKGFNGVVLFTLTSSCDMDESDFRSAILSFRRYTECTGDIIFSRICEPNLEPNHIVAALLLLG